MKAVTKIMTGAAGVAALVGMAAPAAAQYPGYYPGYNNGGNIIGQVLSTILNPYGQQQYAQVSPQDAVNRCATAVHTRLTQRYSAGYGQNPYVQNGYNQYAQNGYNQYAQNGYNQYAQNGYTNSGARVLRVTRVDQRSSTTLRVRGLATSGMTAAYNNPYAGSGGYGGYAGYGGVGGYGAGAGYSAGGGYGGYNTQAAADLSFTCDIDTRGYIRDIDIDRRY